jgi:hypothetical protein
MEAKKAEAKNILVRLPVPTIRKLDRAAKKNGRSRTSEVNLRIAESFRTQKGGVS